VTVANTTISKSEAFNPQDERGHNADLFKNALDIPANNRSHYAKELREANGRAEPLKAILARQFEQHEELEKKRGRYKEIMGEFEKEELAAMQLGSGDSGKAQETEPEEAEVEEED